MHRQRWGECSLIYSSVGMGGGNGGEVENRGGIITVGGGELKGMVGHRWVTRDSLVRMVSHRVEMRLTLT